MCFALSTVFGCGPTHTTDTWTICLKPSTLNDEITVVRFHIQHEARVRALVKGIT